MTNKLIEVLNEMINDYKNLSEEEYYNKYDTCPFDAMQDLCIYYDKKLTTEEAKEFITIFSNN